MPLRTNIMPLANCGEVTTSDPTSGTYSGTAWTYGVDYTTRAALETATGVGIKRLNSATTTRLSTRNATVDAEIEDMISAGIHVVIAAGNNYNKVEAFGGTDYDNDVLFVCLFVIVCEHNHKCMIRLSLILPAPRNSKRLIANTTAATPCNFTRFMKALLTGLSVSFLQSLEPQLNSLHVHGQQKFFLSLNTTQPTAPR